ncbi:right-handed parallel beta-helix repeat-containing protein [Chitinophaga solisilvae]|uniref:right-handed parallel beta-helix repeat-containing protein n=1 Tax=Chitinophaga solisilvae TaxID=1233460 RepID=UPI00136DCCF2|nr:right-handed parallel beta-helix repeat-containing protein [Chitinophaga solisilvae]
MKNRLVQAGIAMSLLCITLSAAAQLNSNFKYRKLPAAYMKKGGSVQAFAAAAPAAKSMKSDAAGVFDLTTLLPRGYVKDGSVDYTDQLQQGIQQHEDVMFPDFPVAVNARGLTLRSNTSVRFQPNSKLLLLPNSKENYEVLRLHQVKQVKVYNPVITGDRKAHQGSGGQWGMGISVRGSQDVTIVSPVVSDCWGDGIYIGDISGKCSSNIIVNDAMLDFNRRNGISVTCVNGLQLNRPVISNTSGTNPKSGIDIEPNSNTDVIDNISINSPVTFNNGSAGIVVSLGKLTGKSLKDVNITVRNHIDDGSFIGFYVYGTKRELPQPMKGSINVENPVWKNCQKKPFLYNSADYGVSTKLKNVEVKRTEASREVTDNNALMNIRKEAAQQKVQVQ